MNTNTDLQPSDYHDKAARDSNELRSKGMTVSARDEATVAMYDQSQEPSAAETLTVQEMIDIVPDGWTVKTLRDDNGTIRDAIFWDGLGKPVAYMVADENGVVTEADCKEWFTAP
jgi:capsid protein